MKNSVDLPAWGKKEKVKNWKEEERERAFEALAELPSSILVESVKSIYRSEKSSQYEKNPEAGRLICRGAWTTSKKTARAVSRRISPIVSSTSFSIGKGSKKRRQK